jgi:hypothetical protein
MLLAQSREQEVLPQLSPYQNTLVLTAILFRVYGLQA